VTAARPKCAIRARPAASTRIFGWVGIKNGIKTGFRTITYSLEISMNYVAGVEKVKAFDNIRTGGGSRSKLRIKHDGRGHLQDQVGLYQNASWCIP